MLLASSLRSEVLGGNDLLPWCIAERQFKAGGVYSLQCAVTGIEAKRGAGATVSWVDRSSVTAGPKEHTADFDYVICTVPFMACRQIGFDPPLSHGKAKAIRELHYDDANRVLLEFSTRWWEQNPTAGPIYASYSMVCVSRSGRNLASVLLSAH